MHYKPKSVAALQIALGGFPDTMHVEKDKGIELSAKTVGELRNLTAWPENLAITTPPAASPDAAIRIGKCSGAKRATPKP
jgi:hypothetical protein